MQNVERSVRETGNTERPLGPQLGLKGHILMGREAWNKENNFQMKDLSLSKGREREKECGENKISR